MSSEPPVRRSTEDAAGIGTAYPGKLVGTQRHTAIWLVLTALIWTFFVIGPLRAVLSGTGDVANNVGRPNIQVVLRLPIDRPVRNEVKTFTVGSNERVGIAVAS